MAAAPEIDAGDRRDLARTPGRGRPRAVAAGQGRRRGRRRSAPAGIGACGVRRLRSARRRRVGRRARPRRCAPARPGAGSSAPWPARRFATVPRSRSCRWPRRSSGSTATASARRSTGAGWAAAQTPQGIRRDLLREAYRRHPADCPGDLDGRGGTPRSLRHAGPRRARRSRQSQGDRSGRPAAGGGAAGRRRARREPGSATTAIRSGRRCRSCSAAWRSRPLRACTGIRTATSPSTRWPTPCSGRPGWAISGACSRPTSGRRSASPAAQLLGEVRRQLADHGWRPQVRRSYDHRRAAEARRATSTPCGSRSPTSSSWTAPTST